MKIKKYKELALLTSLTLSLSGCTHTNTQCEDHKNIIELSEGMQHFIDELNLDIDIDINPNQKTITYDELVKIANELSIDGYIKISILFIDISEELILQLRMENYATKVELSDEFYDKLNFLLSIDDCTSLYLDNLGNEVDLSRLNLKNIKSLVLEYCNENLNCEAFTQKYDSIRFNTVHTSVVTEILKNCACSNTYLYCTNIDFDSIFTFLIDNHINVKYLDVRNTEHYFTENELNLLGKVQTSKLNLWCASFDNIPAQLNLDLNENIQELSISINNKTLITKELEKYDEEHDVTMKVTVTAGTEIKDGELGNIKITTVNPRFQCYFIGAIITENTHFELPTNSIVSMSSIEYTTIDPLYDLSNVQCVRYYIDNTHIEYNAGNDNFDDFINNLEQSQPKEKVFTYTE